MNFKDHCRTCLNNGKEMRHLHTLISICGDDIRLSDILQNFYNYTISDDQYSENICINCVHQLTITYSFKLLIENSYRKLTEMFNASDSIGDNLSYSCDTQDDDCHIQRTFQLSKQNRRLIKNDISAREITPKVVLLFCVDCKSEFNSIKSLNEHCNINHPVRSIVGRDCEYCNEKFEDFRSLVLHRKLHLRPYLCENCWEGFLDAKDLNNHSCHPNKNKTENNKSTEKLLRQCDQCGKSYPPGYINVHMMTHSNDRRYSCKYCPKKFKVPGGLHSHILWNHKRTRNHKCEVCNATFISSSSRSSHIRKNHLKEKKYGCDNCNKRFFSKSELQRHSLTHTGVKNFHCHMCDKSYQTRYGLNVHLKSHTQLSGSVSDLGHT